MTEGEEERSDAGEETKEGDEDEDEEEEKALGELEQDRSPSSACSTCKLPASFGMVRCTKGDCKNCYHKRCLGIKYKPDCDWICAGCRGNNTTLTPSWLTFFHILILQKQLK